MIRPDFILSYWIFAWYILYMITLVKANPKLMLILAIIENIFTLWYIYGYATIENLIYFILVFILTKIIPLATIWNTRIIKRDILVSLCVVIAYILWIYLNNAQINITTVHSLRENRNETPGIYLFHKIKHVLNSVMWYKNL